MAGKDLVLIPEQPDAPVLVTEIPGPNAKALIERDRRVTSPSYTRDYDLVIDHAVGSVVTDPDGNRFLDMTAGIAVTAAGHCHPYVLEAIREQLDRYLHMSGTDFYYDRQILLAERLAALAPMQGTNRVFFTNSGAEAIEAAFKLARHHTGRQHVIAFWGAFHGRTFGALSLSGSKVVHRKRFMPMVPEISHVPYPNPYRPAGPGGAEGAVDFTMKAIEETVFRRQVAPEEVAAIFVEPIQGEGGYIVPPPDFLPRLRELCDRYGILLVCDEVQSGMGRTGKMWAVEHFDVEPDILCSAKGIASGMPLGAMIAGDHVMNWPPGSHASTFGGNPVSCAASLATLDLLEAGLMTNAATVGGYLMERLRDTQNDFPVIGDVRGMGLMVAADFVTDAETRTPDPDTRTRVIHECFRRGLLLLGCGESAIRFCPALTITEKQVARALDVLREALAATARGA
ncbi:MAG TPA: acetyl ornithine aminotransferase family protein [Planctomycetota bacterium]|nr:acetyl ornithine aminotransferase family protein [Planctomycetota bacterium]